MLVREELLRPLPLLRFEKHFKVMSRQQRILPEQREQAVVILDAVNGVVLWDGAIDEQAVEPGMSGVLMADANRSADKPRHDAIVNAAEGVDINAGIVATRTQFAEERKRFQRAFLD